MTKKTKASPPEVFGGTNLSVLWAELFARMHQDGGRAIAPLIVSLEGFDENGKIEEDPHVRVALDRALQAMGKQSVENAAFTIFPQRLWEISGGQRETLYDIYKMALPGYQAMNRKLNSLGLYFERLIDYKRGQENGNQLEWILKRYLNNHAVRHTMLQASVFDPGRDHIAQAQVVFPCLQHVTFVPSEEGLAVNAFYATQQLLTRAYGNFLGLTQLGAFMAGQMGLPLARVNVMVGEEKMQPIKSGHAEVAELKKICDALLRDVADVETTDSSVVEPLEA